MCYPTNMSRFKRPKATGYVAQHGVVSTKKGQWAVITNAQNTRRNCRAKRSWTGSSYSLLTLPASTWLRPLLGPGCPNLLLHHFFGHYPSGRLSFHTSIRLPYPASRQLILLGWCRKGINQPKHVAVHVCDKRRPERGSTWVATIVVSAKRWWSRWTRLMAKL